MSIFEAVMILCFGAAWPFSIYRSYVSRSNRGKSFVFLAVVLVGYIAGVIHKVVYNFDYVILLYVLNGMLVIVDMALYYRNRRFSEMLPA